MNMRLMIAAFSAVLLTTCLRSASAQVLVQIGTETVTSQQYQAAAQRGEAQNGADILKKLVFGVLVTQAAAKDHVQATPQEIDQRIAEIRRRAPDILAAADQNPDTMARFRHDLSTDIALENLRIQHLTVTDEQITAFYEANRKTFALPPQVETTIVVTETAANATKAAQLLKARVSPEDIVRQPGLRVSGVNGYLYNLDGLAPSERHRLSDLIFAAHTGEIKTIHVSGLSLVVLIKKNLPYAVPPLSQIKPQVSRSLRLANAPSVGYELAKLFHDAHPRFLNTQASSMFDDVRKFYAQHTKAAPILQ